MKKIIALLMAVLMTVGMLAACSSTPAETNPPAADETQGQAEVPETSGEKEKVTLKVWADQGELTLIEKLCNEFAAAHPEKEYTFEYGAVGAVDGKTRYLEDPAAAADVFLFADDQLVDLVKADALYEVTRNTDAIIAANTPGSIHAASYEGTLYGYPMTSDNGYFLYYDKSVFTDEDLATLDGILAVANAAGKQVHMDISNGWSEEMNTLKTAVVDALGENYWPNAAIDPEMLEGMFGLTPDMYSDYMAEMPMISTNVDTLLIIRSNDDKVEAVVEALTAYRDNLVADTMQYPMNLGKIQASRIERIGNYVCFVQLGGEYVAGQNMTEEESIIKCQEQNELAIEVISQNLEH